jgi:uncharacterized repeat protein (TIGR03803 family)
MNPNDGWSSRLVVRLGVIVLFFLVLTSHASGEWKEKVLYTFQGGNDGAVPAGGVVFDKQGNLYGATSDGGSANDGTAFELMPPAKPDDAWTESVLHVFRGYSSNGDGASPEGGLVIDAAGNLYGTTAYGGNGPCTLLGSAIGCGAVYEMSPPATKGGAWTETILYNFKGGSDGQFPIGNLTFDGAGNLYGATYFGGGFGSCDSPYYQRCGTIFELSPPKTRGGKWKEKVLYSFKNGQDGANPNGGLIFDKAGALYGSTGWGGFAGNDCAGGNGFVGCGTIFELTPPGKQGGPWREKAIYLFKGRPGDGARPNSNLTFGTNGLLYGTTLGGGEAEEGIVFSLEHINGKVRWVEAILYTFRGGDNSALPMAGVGFNSSGDLYGTASLGGSAGGGVLYELKRPLRDGGAWSYTTHYFFRGAPDGSYPASKLVFDGTGNLYGTTEQGGDAGQNCGHQGCGTVFEVSP